MDLIHVYIDRGKFRLPISTLFIGQFIHPVGGEEIGVSFSQPAASIILFMYIKIWCNFQVKIYLLANLT